MNVNDDFMIDDLLLDAPPTEGGEGSSSLLPSPPYPPSQPAPSPPSFRSPTKSPWDPRLLMDLALMVDSEEDILARYDLTQERLNKLLSNSAFRRELVLLRRDVASNGATFRAKARVQAESYLPELDSLVTDIDVPASVRLDAIKQAVKWADLEPKPVKDGEQAKQPQINVQINF